MVTTPQVLFPWKPEYSVQHPGIDGQHLRLVALVNDLYAAMTEGQGRTAAGRILTGLVRYTETHFAYEEEQMQRAGYPSVAQHKELHRKLLQQVDQYVKQWEDGQSVSAVELSSFLKDWLLTHIAQTDRPLAAHLTKRP